jgi:hypothetical protein
MSLDQEQLRQHCQFILSSRRIRNRVVVLCEGNRELQDERPSPQTYSRMERLPDANFYKACVPKWWRELRPEFFNCGGRGDVLDTYFALLAMHSEDSSSSYLIPEKLFVIVDLDVQAQTIGYDYLFGNTEEIFLDLYDRAKVNQATCPNHRIWVTGLVHKEAYFLLPFVQATLDQEHPCPNYKENPLLLDNVYVDMANELECDVDLRNHFLNVIDRVSHCSELDCSELSQFKTSWLAQYDGAATDQERREELVFTLLAIRKAKQYWNQIQPSGGWTRSASDYRDQLVLQIGRFYSERCDNQRNHLESFFKVLYQAR